MGRIHMWVRPLVLAGPVILTQEDRPPLLTVGSTVAVIAPAGRADPGRLDRGLQVLVGWGLQPMLAPNIGLFGGTRAQWVAQRRSDLRWALLESGAEAVWAARGGFGAAHLLSDLAQHDRVLTQQGRTVALVGFSDITAMHSAISALGLSQLLGVHGPVVTALGDLADEATVQRTRDLVLAGTGIRTVVHPVGVVPPASDPLPLVGGNLATLSSLVGTPHLAELGGCLLVLEDVGEGVPQLDRLATQLELSGRLAGVHAVLLGSFSSSAGNSGERPELVKFMAERLGAMGIPVAVGLPVGHTAANWPWVVGAPARLV